MYHHLGSIECPECLRAFQEYISPQQVKIKRRHMFFWAAMVCLLVAVMAVIGVWVLLTHQLTDSTVGRYVALGVGATVLIVVFSLRYHRWDERWLPQRGTLLIETDGTPHVHLGDSPQPRDRVGPLGVTVFRSFLTIEPFMIKFDMIPGGMGTIRTYRQSNVESVGYQWEILNGHDWRVVVQDPFEWIEFANHRESLTWKLKYKQLSLIAMLRFVCAWPSVADFVAHVTQGSNTIEAPLGRLAELEYGLQSLKEKVEDCTPRPIHGGRLSQFVGTLRVNASEVELNPPEESRALMTIEVLRLGLGDHDLGVDSSNRPEPEAKPS